MLTPGIAGGVTMLIANALWVAFSLPPRWTSLVLSFLLGLFGQVEINAVKHKVQDGRGVFVLLDARDRASFLAGHIPGALSVPLDQAAEAVKILAADRQYVTYCWSHT